LWAVAAALRVGDACADAGVDGCSRKFMTRHRTGCCARRPHTVRGCEERRRGDDAPADRLSAPEPPDPQGARPMSDLTTTPAPQAAPVSPEQLALFRLRPRITAQAARQPLRRLGCPGPGMEQCGPVWTRSAVPNPSAVPVPGGCSASGQHLEDGPDQLRQGRAPRLASAAVPDRSMSQANWSMQVRNPARSQII
jgi:hypothetical protein